MKALVLGSGIGGLTAAVRLHDHGHGGSGATVCWGCAGDVVRLAGAP